MSIISDENVSSFLNGFHTYILTNDYAFSIFDKQHGLTGFQCLSHGQSAYQRVCF
jgi:hypothetical protein